MPQHVTTRTIAAASGFGQSTVSMALRNDPRIPEETRKMIHETAERLGYQPDPQIARLMASIQRGRVARAVQPLAYVLLWPSSERYYSLQSYREYRKGAEERAREFGYSFEDFVVNEGGVSPKRLTRILRTRAIPGMLIAPVNLSYESPEFHGLDLQLACEEFSVSTIGYSLANPCLNRVTHDHALAAETAMATLTSRGFRRIGFVCSHAMHVRVQGRWLAGYLLAQHLLAEKNRLAPLIMDHIRDEVLFDQWFEKAKPDCIVTVEFDEVRDHLKRRGIDLQAIGVAHLDATTSKTVCAGIDQCNLEVGAAAFEILLAQILRHQRGIPALRRTVMLEGRWKEGPGAGSAD